VRLAALLPLPILSSDILYIPVCSGEHGKTEQDMNQMKDNFKAAIRTRYSDSKHTSVRKTRCRYTQQGRRTGRDKPILKKS
jgi:hypothetical protein